MIEKGINFEKLCTLEGPISHFDSSFRSAVVKTLDVIKFHICFYH